MLNLFSIMNSVFVNGSFFKAPVLNFDITSITNFRDYFTLLIK